MARFDFHGLTVETESALPGDPAALLLAGLDPARSAAAADVRIRLRAGGPEALGPRVHGPPDFVYGAHELRIDGGGVELVGPGARLAVRGAEVDGLVAAAMLERGDGLDLLAHGPVLMALSVALRSLGRYHLHAACLVVPEVGTVLVPGLSGSGKSTLTITLARLGAGFLGDDTLYVERAAGALRLLAVPREFHLSARSAAAAGVERFVRSGALTLAGKGRLDPSDAFPGQLRRSAAPPAVILLPQVARAATTRLEPAGPAAALGALLENSVLVAARGLPGGAGHLDVLARLADGARTVRAALGRDLLEEPSGTARRIVEGLGGTGACAASGGR